MLRLTLMLCFLGLSTLPAFAQDASAKPKAEEKWIQLFNGKDLTGWTPKIRYHELGDNFGDTFRVENGVLRVSYDKYDKFGEKFGHLFYKDAYGHYRIRAEYRFVGEQCPGGPGWAIRNSGIMIHGQAPETMSKDQDFPASIEVQLLGGFGKPRTTANLCTPYTHVVMNDKLHTPHCTNSKSKTYDGEQWVTVEVEVHGSKVIKHFINGEEVLTYSGAQIDPKEAVGKKLLEKAGGEVMIEKGTISLQSESHPVEFRKVELLVLEE